MSSNIVASSVNVQPERDVVHSSKRVFMLACRRRKLMERGAMESLLQFVTAVPEFISSFVALLWKPKRFLRGRLVSSPERWAQALRFYAVGEIAVAVLSAAGEQDLKLEALAHDLTNSIGSSVVSGFVVFFAWRIALVALDPATVIIWALYTGVVQDIILAKPGAYLVDFVRHCDQISGSSEAAWTRAEICTVVVLGVFVFATGWLIVVWGSLRQAVGATRLRSGLAFLIYAAGLFGAMHLQQQTAEFLQRKGVLPPPTCTVLQSSSDGAGSSPIGI